MKDLQTLIDQLVPAIEAENERLKQFAANNVPPGGSLRILYNSPGSYEVKIDLKQGFSFMADYLPDANCVMEFVRAVQVGVSSWPETVRLQRQCSVLFDSEEEHDEAKPHNRMDELLAKLDQLIARARIAEFCH